MYNPIVDGVGFNAVLKLTGPITYSLCIEPLRSKFPNTVGNDKDFGLIYSILNSSEKEHGQHHDLFVKHYSTLFEPVIKQAWYINFLFKLMKKFDLL